jgi:hypothetical protein
MKTDYPRSLYNTNPVPPGLRHCYWDADYIASQPFCITSKLTEKESQDLAEFEELKFWERFDSVKAELSESDLDETLEEVLQDDLSIDVKKAVDLYFASPKKFYFAGFVKNAKEVGFYNIQPSDGVPSFKTSTSREFRQNYLTR